MHRMQPVQALALALARVALLQLADASHTRRKTALPTATESHILDSFSLSEYRCVPSARQFPV